jgi:hypothetical protein
MGFSLVVTLNLFQGLPLKTALVRDICVVPEPYASLFAVGQKVSKSGLSGTYRTLALAAKSVKCKERK